MTPPSDDRDLAARARQGDRAALANLVARLRVPLFRSAYAALGDYDDAQDAVASVLVEVVLHIGDLRSGASIRFWCETILRNEIRRLRRRRDLSHDCLVLDQPPAEPSVEQSLLRLDIERCLAQLPRDQARAIALFYLAGLPIDQISYQLVAPAGTVKYWLHQGRRRLAESMKGYSIAMKTNPKARKAAIVSTDMDQAAIENLQAALRRAGWNEIALISEYSSAGSIAVQHAEGTSAVSLPPSLAGCDCILLDEWIGGRSSFELVALYNAIAERDGVTLFCLLGDKKSNPSIETSVQAAFVLGVDALLTKPYDFPEFENLARLIFQRGTRPHGRT